MASAAGHASIGSALSLQLLPRMVVTIVVAAAALLGLAAIMPNFDVSSFGAAVGLAAVGGVVGAEAVHRLLRGWLARLGHEAYAEPVKA
jgi:hypothetical protein